MIGISSRQADVLDCIKKSLRDHGMPPTAREIADAIGHKSVGSVTPMLKALIRKGFVKKPRAGMSRGIIPIGMNFAESGRHTNAEDSSMVVEVVIETANGKTKHLQLVCRSIVIRKCGPTMGRARKRP